MHTHTLPIIGYHRSPLTQKFGIPRQPNLVDIKSHIELIAPFDNPDAFVGIEAYSHLWLLWHFHHNKKQPNFRPQVRPPRFGGNEKVGVFATRSMYRPSEIGLSVVGFDGLEVIDNKVILHICGADMVDGTPIFDIKPYLPYVDSVVGAMGVDKPSGKPVKFDVLDFDALDIEKLIKNQLLNEQDIDVIKALIAQDPRPAYRQHEINIMCSMRYKAVDVDFCMNEHGEMVVGAVRMV